jgi:hypothetical protein
LIYPSGYSALDYLIRSVLLKHPEDAPSDYPVKRKGLPSTISYIYPAGYPSEELFSTLLRMGLKPTKD